MYLYLYKIVRRYTAPLHCSCSVCCVFPCCLAMNSPRCCCQFTYAPCIRVLTLHRASSSQSSAQKSSSRISVIGQRGKAAFSLRQLFVTSERSFVHDTGMNYVGSEANTIRLRPFIFVQKFTTAPRALLKAALRFPLLLYCFVRPVNDKKKQPI